jgi:hypothetical protein
MVVGEGRLAPLGRGDRQLARTGEPSLALDDSHIPPPGERGQPAGERRDHLILAGPEPVEVDPGRLEMDAPVLHLAGLRQHAADVQERLGGNAAPEQAGAPEPRVAVDDRDLHAEVGRQKRRRVAAGTTAEHDERSMHQNTLGPRAPARSPDRGRNWDRPA